MWEIRHKLSSIIRGLLGDSNSISSGVSMSNSVLHLAPVTLPLSEGCAKIKDEFNMLFGCNVKYCWLL